MNKTILFLVSLFIITNLCAQKPQIDSLAIRKWPSVANPAISNNGEYNSYTINNQPIGSNTLVIKSSTSNWKKEIIDVSESFFVGDNRQIVYKKNDTLYFLTLGTNNQTYISNINSYKQPQTSKGEWLTYQVNSFDKELVLMNLFTGKKQHFTSVTDYSFNDKSNVLLLNTQVKQESITINALHWISLPEGNMVTIYSKEFLLGQESPISYYTFDSDGSQLVFIVQDKKDNQPVNTIWYYKAGMDKAVMRVNDQSTGIEPGTSISNDVFHFSNNGLWIFFNLQQVENRKPKPSAVKVDVLSYNKDIILQPQQQYIGPKTFLAAINVEGNKVVRVEREDDEVVNDTRGEYCNYGDNIVISYKKFSVKWWDSSYYSERYYYLFSLQDETRKLIKKESAGSFSFSPKGRYLIYFDNKQKNYFSYDITSGKTRNISQAIPTSLIDERFDDLPEQLRFPSEVGIAGWIEQEESLLIYDNYDIWRVYPEGNKFPVNITNGYGHMNHIKLKLVYVNNVYSGKAPLLLTGFNILNKYNGFYKMHFEAREDPELLIMGPYTLYRTESQKPHDYSFDDGMQPLRAGEVNSWIVKRQTANDAPNYFFTKDFKSYLELSNLQPQTGYNWLTTQLVNWKQLDGTPSQGILYKPENFDPYKKYPVIFNYYEKLSHSLYEFPIPEFTESNINIPWFVSQGYLVFTPDIHYTIGKTGQSVYNTVVSAAQYLSKLPYVDGKKMAIQGHSFGGFETNYLVTHSHLFAAAAEVAGTSDFISSYGTGKQYIAEFGQGRMGATPWQRPDIYIDNTPIFKADEVTTPLLIMHNKADFVVLWAQGIEFFLALHRLEKKVWMLQYDNGNHAVSGKEAEDYTIRLNQFFDYYLKGTPPPKWMTVGVPARLKGIETGLELDTSGRQP